jgi:hypothetical protein
VQNVLTYCRYPDRRFLGLLGGFMGISCQFSFKEQKGSLSSRAGSVLVSLKDKQSWSDLRQWICGRKLASETGRVSGLLKTAKPDLFRGVRGEKSFFLSAFPRARVLNFIKSISFLRKKIHLKITLLQSDIGTDWSVT